MAEVEEQFGCEDCGAAFPTERDLHAHQQSAQSDETESLEGEAGFHEVEMPAIPVAEARQDPNEPHDGHLQGGAGRHSI